MPIPENVRNTAGFDKNPQNINKKGQPISIKRQLKELLAKDGELPIPASQLKGKKTVDGIEYYIFKLPTQEALALKLITTAMSRGTNGLKALNILLERFDGRPVQTIEAEINTPTIKGITFEE